MKALQLTLPEQGVFARAALALRFGEGDASKGQRPAPVTFAQLNQVRRIDDVGHSLWSTFQRVQENAIRGGLPGRTVQGNRMPRACAS